MRLGVLAHPEHPSLPEVLPKLRRLTEDLEIEVRYAPDLSGLEGTERGPWLDEVACEIDCLLTLGGDGTLLRGARLAGPRNVPVVGLNLGHLGFLTTAPVERLEEILVRLRDGQCSEDRRLALCVEIARSAADRETEEYYALNDAVVHKGGFARLIAMRVWVDQDEVGQYSADGIVIATATGSTAYSLSAGGPILVPDMDALIATPICPHTMAVRPLVVSADSRITVEIASRMEGILVTIDGQTGAELGRGDRLAVKRSPHPVRLVRLPDQSFFSVLRQKLRWGDVRPSGR